MGLLRIIAGLFIFGVNQVSADDLMDFPDMDGGHQSWFNESGSIGIGYWNSSRDLNEINSIGAASLLFSAEPALSDTFTVKLEARGDRSFLDGDNSELRVNEFYFEYPFSSFDLSIGRQVEAWGRADRLNPTDKIGPKNYTLLVSEDSEQRFGTFMLKSVYYFEEFSLTSLWLPDFEPNMAPLVENPQVVIEEYDVSDNRSWALKLDRSGGAVDWSLSYFDGFNVTADLGLEGFVGQQVVVSKQHNPLRLIGADLATTVGNFGLRAEMAYAHTSDAKGDEPYVMNHYAEVVIGGDRTFYENLNVNLQLFNRHVFDFNDPATLSDPTEQMVAIRGATIANQLDEDSYGVTARISDRWFNTTLEAELAAVYRLPRKNYVIRAKAKYKFTDSFSGTVAADWFRGPAESYYGSLRDNSLVFIGLRYQF